MVCALQGTCPLLRIRRTRVFNVDIACIATRAYAHKTCRRLGKVPTSTCNNASDTSAKTVAQDRNMTQVTASICLLRVAKPL